MRLNLPILDELSTCKNLLIAGMGGGFDVYCGLPIYFELRERGQTVHLANLSFANIVAWGRGEDLGQGVVGVRGSDKGYMPYFPELHLARWFQEAHNEDVPIWCFTPSGAKPLLAAYRRLIEHLHIDGILLVDGGVDSLIRGDEAEVGTVLEDAYSLSAVHQITEVSLRRLVCLGLGAEQDMCHAHIFENIAALAESGGFLGSCSLTKQMPAYRQYEAAIEFAHSRSGQDASVINASIVSAVRGEYGNYHLTEKTRGSKLWISPLMPIYWCFDAVAVAERCAFLPSFARSRSNREARQILEEYRALLPRRPTARVPL